MKTVLSIDGGGIFGLIPLQVLVAVEQELGEPLASKFDLITGNSAGSIIGSMLAHGRSAEDASKLFVDEMPKIFKEDWWRRIRTANYFFGAKYSGKHAETVSKREFPMAMSEAQTKLMIVSYDMQNREPYFFKSWKDRNVDTPTWQAVMASSAAPTYFKPREFNDGTARNLTDGAVTANNPAMCAYAEAVRLWPNEKIRLISLGTGEIRKSFSNNWSRNWGLIAWAQRVSGLILDGGIDAVNYQLNAIEGVTEELDYLRIDTLLSSKEFSDMDDASKNHMNKLILQGQMVAGNNTETFVNLIR